MTGAGREGGYHQGMLVLFDVDGTLILARGAGVKSMVEAGRRLIGPRFTLEGVEIAGRLDPLIWADAAALSGVENPDRMHAVFREMYAEALSARLAAERPAYLLPGVQSLIDRLRRMDGLTLGLLTGNYPETGRMKLEAAGLDPQAFVVAAWGTDGATRRELPAAAIRRYREQMGEAIEPARVVVIGDTPYDVDCAHACGCLAVAVATGPAFSLEELQAHGPDLALADLTDTDGIVAWMAARARALAQ